MNYYAIDCELYPWMLGDHGDEIAARETANDLIGIEYKLISVSEYNTLVNHLKHFIPNNQGQSQ